MTLPWRCGALLVTCLWACGGGGGGSEESSTGLPLTTDEPATTGSTTVEPTTAAESSSSTGLPPGIACEPIADKAACAAEPECQWKGTVQYEHGAQGCQGSIREQCVAKNPAGGASAWYRGEAPNLEVVEFGYTPTGLGPEWTECGCDGPLACLCSSVSEACPERLEAFCGAVTTQPACTAVNIQGDARCAWLSVSPEGPADADCADSAQKDLCLPAANASADTCTPPVYSLTGCMGYPNEIYWREVAGIIEVTTACGPQPTGFTRCEGDDTPDQPDECRCRCL